MIPMQLMIGQLTKDSVPFPTGVRRVFIQDDCSLKFRGSTDATKLAAQRRATRHFESAKKTILRIEGEFTRTMLKEQRLVCAATSTIHRVCQQLKEDGLIQVVRKQGKNEFYRVITHGQIQSAS
jgi:hypothetical protein